MCGNNQPASRLLPYIIPRLCHLITLSLTIVSLSTLSLSSLCLTSSAILLCTVHLHPVCSHKTTIAHCCWQNYGLLLLQCNRRMTVLFSYIRSKCETWHRTIRHNIVLDVILLSLYISITLPSLICLYLLCPKHICSTFIVLGNAPVQASIYTTSKRTMKIFILLEESTRKIYNFLRYFVNKIDASNSIRFKINFPRICHVPYIYNHLVAVGNLTNMKKRNKAILKFSR